MSPPIGDLQRVVALLTAVEGKNGLAILDLLGEFTQADTLRLASMYLEAIRQHAGGHGVPMPAALQILGRCAAEHVEGGPS